MYASSVKDLPTPTSLTYFWNFGSLLGFALTIQIITGFFLAMHYISDGNMTFLNIFHITRDVNYGWLLRYTHANCASLLFIFIYIHICRGLYYGSYLRKSLWFSGWILLVLMMITAFVGYVLPWGQMSFWGATVITNFFSAIPNVGKTIVYWIWGGYSVTNVTLNRFYSIHYMFPFLIIGMIFIHLIILHVDIATNPLGVGSKIDVVSFKPYYKRKDMLGIIITLFFLFTLVFFKPNLLGDVENYIPANPLITPIHIVPEWYFLFAYTILRWVPNKSVGLSLLAFSIIVLLLIPFLHTSKQKSIMFRPFGKGVFFFL